MHVVSLTVLILAGEASGDTYGAGVARALKARVGDLRLVGTGGPRMSEAGVELMAGLDQLAVMGFAEIVTHLEFFRDLERRVIERIWDVDVVLLVDYPGFNMRVARAAHDAGRPVLYYIAPKVWAWRAGRAKALAETTDRVAAIFPFEVEVLRSAGVNATFVGNPLLDDDRELDDADVFHRRWSLDPDRPLLAVLPGSRQQELDRHMEPFLEAVRLVREARPDVQAALAKAPTLPDDAYDVRELPVVEDTRALLRHARAGLVKSGTSTLEAALEDTPSVVAYRTSALSWAVVERVLRVEHVSLPNLVAAREVVPELIQDAMTPRRMADALLPLLDEDSAERRAQLEGFREVRERLGGPGAAERVAELALGLVDARR